MLFLSLPQRMIAAKLDAAAAEPLRRRERASLALPLDRIAVFDTASGQRL